MKYWWLLGLLGMALAAGIVRAGEHDHAGDIFHKVGAAAEKAGRKAGAAISAAGSRTGEALQQAEKKVKYGAGQTGETMEKTADMTEIKAESFGRSVAVWLKYAAKATAAFFKGLGEGLKEKAQ